MTATDYDHLRGARVVDREGQTIGDVEQLYTDRIDDTLLAVSVRTGLFGARHVLVPVINASVGWQRIDVPYLRRHVNAAPIARESQRESRSAHPHLSPVTEAEIAAHYELTTLR